jgi:hypothetical protein
MLVDQDKINPNSFDMQATSNPVDAQVIVQIGGDGSATSGYLFVCMLKAGMDGEVILLRSIPSGELVVRKYAKTADHLPSHEVIIHSELTRSGFEVPKFVSYEGSVTQPTSMTVEFANGGSVAWYWEQVLVNQEHCANVREAFCWYLLAEMLRLFTYLHTGWSCERPARQHLWTDVVARSRWKPPPYSSRPWNAILHSDCHLGNMLLDFRRSDPVTNGPAILINDFGRARRRTSSWDRQSTAEDIKIFLKVLLELHVRRSAEESTQLPSIVRAVNDIGQRLSSGEGALEMCKSGGLHDRFWANFVNLGVRLPDPTPIPQGGRAMVFDLTGDPSSCVDDALALRKLFRMEASCKLWKIGTDTEVEELNGMSRIPMSAFRALSENAW